MLTKELSMPARGTGAKSRAWIVAEVAFASFLTPVLWQGFKRFTSLGQLEVSSGLNFSAGVVTFLVTVGIFLARRKNPTEYGLSFRTFSDQLKTGMSLALIAMVVFLLSRLVFVNFHGNLQSAYGGVHSPFLMDAAVAALFLAFFPWILKFSQRLLTVIPTSVAVVILLCLWMAPLGIAYVLQRSLIHTFLVVLGLIVTTGFAEEFFYWGYIQPRLNEVWGRSRHFGGIRFGWGLVVTSILFGLVHSLNGVDFLHGHLTSIGDGALLR